MVDRTHKIGLPPLNSQWLSNLPPAFFSAIIITITSTAAISMIFKGELSVYLSIGISCALIGAIIVNMISKFVCIFPFAISCMTPNAAVVMGLFMHEIFNQNLSKIDTFYTVFAAFLFTSLVTAIFLFCIGAFKIGKLIRYMPYPVLCGFFAGVGWYLFLGAFTIVGIDLKEISLDSDFKNLFYILLPPFLFAATIFIIQKIFKNPFNYLILIIGGVVVFYLYLMIANISIDDATQANLTIKSPHIEFLYEHINSSMFTHIHWKEIFSRWGYIFSFAIVNLLSLLAYTINFEETSYTNADLNREVKFIGFSNIIGALFSGGTTIFTTQSLTHRATGANHSVSVLYVSLFCIVILFFSNQIIPYIPKFIVSGILITNGFFLIEKWLIRISQKISLDEWSIIAIIFLVMIFQGFIEGVAMGLALAFVLFIFNNSKSPIIRYEAPGAEFISNASYPVRKLKVLQKSGERIHIIKLQGYFFFGSAERLHTHVKNKVLLEQGFKVEYLILDFSFVIDIDSTAIHTLIKIHTILHDKNCILILTGLNKKSRKHLGMQTSSQKKLEFIPYLKSMELETKKGKIYVFEDMDAGLEWAEKHVIDITEEGPISQEEKLLLGFREFLSSQSEIDIFLSYLEKITLRKGEALITPDNADSCMYFIESGQVAYLIKKNGKGFKRIREFGPGHIIGEIQFYLHSDIEDMKITCSDDCTFYKLNKNGVNELEDKYPKIALKFTNWMISIISERISHMAKEIRSLV